jgi:deoxyribodipyrimidine photolyase-related protein
MTAITLIFPHQLFQQAESLHAGRDVYMVEEYLYFTQYKFHQQKIVLHRASMQFYKNYLTDKKYTVTYIDAQQPIHDVRNLIPHLASLGITEVHITEVVDFNLHKRIEELFNNSNIKICWYTTPMFINTSAENVEYSSGKKTYYQTDFYTYQRKKLKILLTPEGKPVGGKWTFDTDNRSKYPKGKVPPSTIQIAKNKFYTEAQQYAAKYYSANYGTITDDIIYPTTYAESEAWLTDFLNNRFAEFGEYEDAMVDTENILHHSVLTPMLNIGLLTPAVVIDKAIAFAENNEIPLNALEGFIRQIIGWREFIRMVYEQAGVTQRTKNYWQFSNKIPASFYNGTTGIQPIDDTIKKLLQTGYNHHIERLMLLGNFMLLCEFDPNQVYKWFMEMYIDAYDWVMVPNVYGMTQFADGGLMTSKPYISGSNYIFKMSNYKKGLAWANAWDGLFWHFMHKQRNFFLSNPRLGMLVHMFDKMPANKQQQHLAEANNYFKQLKQA